MARLPIPSSDDGSLGELLNEFLRVSHNEDGTIHGQATVINVRDFGAVGDGIANDTTAFQQAAAEINAAGGGTLFIPPGTYVVGRQSLIDGIHQGDDIIYIHDCTRPIIIQGSGATLKAADGLKIGHFNGQKAIAYWGMVRIEKNTMVTIRDLELDGNSYNLEVGAKDPLGYLESPAYGIYAHRNENVLIENIYTHHHGLDGVLIGYDGMGVIEELTPPRSTPHTLINVVSEYNTRDALSWVGGIGLTAINCKFNYSGQAEHSSGESVLLTSPIAGLDIEPENSICRRGNFIGCEFNHNKGSSVTAGSPLGSDITFRQCLFWGAGYYTLLIRSSPRIIFEDCTIYGSCIAGSPSGAFVRCHFEDLDHPIHGVFRTEFLAVLEADQLVLDNCTVIANQLKAIFAELPVTKYIRNTTITHRYDGLPDQHYQSLLRHCVLENVLFKEDINTPPQTFWFIGLDTEVQFDNVYVQGPSIKWYNWSWGITGQIGISQTIPQPKLLINNDQRPGPFIGQKTIVVMDGAPTTGEWSKGDIVLSQHPEAGGNIGWVCIMAGDPGTWRAFGQIDT